MFRQARVKRSAGYVVCTHTSAAIPNKPGLAAADRWQARTWVGEMLALGDTDRLADGVVEPVGDCTGVEARKQGRARGAHNDEMSGADQLTSPATRIARAAQILHGQHRRSRSSASPGWPSR